MEEKLQKELIECEELNNEYKNHNNSFDSLSLNPPRSNCTMISQSSNDRDDSDESDDSVDCDIPDDFDNLNFIETHVLETEIIDTGIGINSDRQKMLFVPFLELKTK